MKQGRDVTINEEENAMLLYFHRLIRDDLPEKEILEQRQKKRMKWNEGESDSVQENQWGSDLEAALGGVCEEEQRSQRRELLWSEKQREVRL